MHKNKLESDRISFEISTHLSHKFSIQQKREQENSNNTECEFSRSGIFHPQYSNEN